MWSVYLDREPCKTAETDRDAVWVVHSPRTMCQTGSISPYEKGQF